MLDLLVEELRKRGCECEVTTDNNGALLRRIEASIDGRHVLGFNCENLTITTENVTELADSISESFKSVASLDVSEVLDNIRWDDVKDNLMLCIQPSTSLDILKKEFMGMEVYVRYCVNEYFDLKISSSVFPNQSEDEIFKQAWNNVKDSFSFVPIADVLGDISIPGDTLSSRKKIEMYLLTNRNSSYGAVSICNLELFKEFANEKNSDLVIIPSSVDECLVYCDNEPCVYFYKDMLSFGNARLTQMNQKKVLSDNVFIYRRGDKSLVVA